MNCFNTFVRGCLTGNRSSEINIRTSPIFLDDQRSYRLLWFDKNHYQFYGQSQKEYVINEPIIWQRKAVAKRRKARISFHCLSGLDCTQDFLANQKALDFIALQNHSTVSIRNLTLSMVLRRQLI